MSNATDPCLNRPIPFTCGLGEPWSTILDLGIALLVVCCLISCVCGGSGESSSGSYTKSSPSRSTSRRNNYVDAETARNLAMYGSPSRPPYRSWTFLSASYEQYVHERRISIVYLMSPSYFDITQECHISEWLKHLCSSQPSSYPLLKLKPPQLFASVVEGLRIVCILGTRPGAESSSIIWWLSCAQCKDLMKIICLEAEVNCYSRFLPTPEHRHCPDIVKVEACGLGAKGNHAVNAWQVEAARARMWNSS